MGESEKADMPREGCLVLSFLTESEKAVASFEN